MLPRRMPLRNGAACGMVAPRTGALASVGLGAHQRFALIRRSRMGWYVTKPTGFERQAGAVGIWASVRPPEWLLWQEMGNGRHFGGV